jgi:RimJ/RimL family protein N-acetyltransferase
MGHPLWPPYDLRLRTPMLELRLPTEPELAELCRVARAGVHDPSVMPFEVPWTDRPSPQFERGFVQFHWRQRADWSPERWSLELAVFRDGEPMGMQAIGAADFAVLRDVYTGSWLGQPFQGRGYGKQMRAAVLELAFGGLAAVTARSSVWVGNAASIAVSRALGYQANGVSLAAPRGEPLEHRQMRLTRPDWLANRYCEVEVAGLGSCREMFGAG